MHEKSHSLLFYVLAIALAVISCGEGEEETPRVSIIVVGPQGATIDGPEDMTLIIPQGALDSSTEIKITATDIVVPQITQGSSVISVEPIGTVFKKPSHIVIPFELKVGTNVNDYKVIGSKSPGAEAKKWIPYKSVVRPVIRKVEADVLETGYFVVGINPYAGVPDTDSGSSSDSESATGTGIDTGMATGTETNADTGTAEQGDSTTASVQTTDSNGDTGQPDTATVDTGTATGGSDGDTDTVCPALPAGTTLFDITTMGGAEAFDLYGELEATFEWATVTDQSFNGAVRVTTSDFTGLPADIQTYRALDSSIAAGDHLALQFWTRCVSSAGAACRTSAVLGESEPSNLTIAAYYVTASGSWTLHQIPFVSPLDYANTNYLSFHMGYPNQTIEIAGVRLIDYGQIADAPRLDCLPDTTELYTATKFVSTPAVKAFPGFIYNYAVEINGYPRPAVTYTSGPSWLTFDSGTLLLSGVPPLSAANTTETVNIDANGIGQSWFIEIAESPGTVGYWPFDESAGTVTVDASSNGRDAAVFGDPVWQADGGHINGAISLDSYTGALDYVEISSDTDLELNDLQYASYSLSAWVKPNRIPEGTSDADNTGASGIVLKRAGGTLSTGLYYSRDQRFIAIHAFNARAYAAYAGPYDIGEWHHVTSVRDMENNTLTLYVDGVAKYSGPLTPPADDTDTTPDTDYEYGTTPWRIGLSEPNAEVSGMYGDITVDEVRFFSRALTASEIRNLQH